MNKTQGSDLNKSKCKEDRRSEGKQFQMGTGLLKRKKDGRRCECGNSTRGGGMRTWKDDGEIFLGMVTQN